jgi:hypothetical protein
LLRRLGLLCIAGLLATAATAGAQSGNFDVGINGKPVGTASFDVKATPQGYDSSALVRITMKGFNYSLSKTEKLDAKNQLVHVLLSGTVNGSAVSITGRPDAANILLNISANGRSTPTRLDKHPAAVVLADFDAGALETLLVMAAQHNNRDLWAVIPKGAGTIEPVKLATYADQQGTLNGKPITVHHLVATIGAGANGGQKTDLFSGSENQLLQAELPQQGFALVRKGFVLTPPAKPGAPPEQPKDIQAPPQPQAQPQVQ